MKAEPMPVGTISSMAPYCIFVLRCSNCGAMPEPNILTEMSDGRELCQRCIDE